MKNTSIALREQIKQYSLATFKKDLLAAFVVSLIALPLSMALAIAVGLPPQQGIYTAIIAGFIIPLLGGSNWQVSGPTAAFVVILAPIVADFGLRGIIWANIFAGFILIAMGLARLGRFIRYIPEPVIIGFTAGIAVVLGALSLNDFLGLGIKLEGHTLEKVGLILKHLSLLNSCAFLIGCITLLLLLTAHRLIRGVPSAIIAVGVATLLATIFSYCGYDIPTVGSVFSYYDHEGHQLPGIPPYLPSLHVPFFSQNNLFSIPSFQELKTLLFPALTIAILAALESLLSAMVADNMTGTKHTPNTELNALGIGNILSALAAGIPATGAIARTASNINNGAKTPLAAAMHALFIMLYVLFFSAYINYIPMTALAAILIYTAYRMSHHKQFFNMIKKAPQADVIVLLVCFLLTVFIDMVVGIGVGMICAMLLNYPRRTGDDPYANQGILKKFRDKIMPPQPEQKNAAKADDGIAE